MKNNLIKSIKVFIALGILGYLFSKTDIHTFSKVATKINYTYFFLAILLIALVVFCNSMRWLFLLRSRDIKIPLLLSARLSFIGAFFNSFIPSTIGGDTVKILRLKDAGHKFEDIISATILDRFIGFLSLLSVLAVFALIDLHFFLLHKKILILIFVLIGIALFVLAVIFNRTLLEKFKNLQHPLLNGNFLLKVKDKLEKLYESMHMFQEKRSTLYISYLFSILIKIIAIFAAYSVNIAVNMGVPLKYFLVFSPLISCLTMIPISSYGLGIREGLAFFLYSKVGAQLENILVYSLLIYLSLLFVSFCGGIIYIIDNIVEKKHANK